MFEILRAGLAAVQVAAGHPREAQDSLAQVTAHDLDDVPRDQPWLALLGVLAPTAVAVRPVSGLSC